MTDRLWTLREVLDAVKAQPLISVDLLALFCSDIQGISIDTRTLQEGDLFFAIDGESRDGHDFVKDAVSKGAAAVVVDLHRAEQFRSLEKVIPVTNVLEALQDLGRAARARSRAGIVAVTGSVGKTGTKEALRLLLSGTHASVASYNNHWGVPLTLARMSREARYGIFEIGMNHAGEIAPLTRMVRPQVAVITTIEPVHIAYFRSIWGIADAKGEIFGGLEPGGTAVINRDSPYYERLRAHAGASPAGRILSFGEHAEADIRAERILLRPDGSMVEARVLGQPLTYRIGSAGRHVAMNSLAVLGAVKALGADVGHAAQDLAELRPPIGRGERIVLEAPSGAFTLIDESYNANPASMRAALATLGSIEPGPGGRRIAVMGDMLELGEEAQAMHRGLAESVESNGVDLVFAAGPLMAALFEALPGRCRGAHAGGAADLEAIVLGEIRAGDAVMVKGSNSTRVSRIVKALRERYEAGRPSTAALG